MLALDTLQSKRNRTRKEDLIYRILFILQYHLIPDYAPEKVSLGANWILCNGVAISDLNENIKATMSEHAKATINNAILNANWIIISVEKYIEHNGNDNFLIRLLDNEIATKLFFEILERARIQGDQFGFTLQAICPKYNDFIASFADRKLLLRTEHEKEISKIQDAINSHISRYGKKVKTDELSYLNDLLDQYTRKAKNELLFLNDKNYPYDKNFNGYKRFLKDHFDHGYIYEELITWDDFEEIYIPASTESQHQRKGRFLGGRIY